jgi:threonine dehydratase
MTLEDNPLLMAATGGSLAIEIFKDIPQVKNIIAPIGHGDMMAGLAYYSKKKYPDITLIGCHQSDAPYPKGKTTSNILNTKIDHLSLHLDEELIEGVLWMLHHHQCLIDPSAAIVVAACLQEKRPHLEGPTAVILSSRHIDTQKLKELLL